MIERTFQDIPDGKIEDADQHELLVSLGWSIGTSWGELLQSKRILIVSEAGAGKTHECQDQSKLLSNAGEPAFFVELSSLATVDLRDLFDSKEGARLDSWISSPDEEATFFLDSIDELKLTQHSFKLALKRFKKGIKDQLHRAKIVITTRPILFDESLIRELLPIPPAQPKGSKEERFAEIMTRERLQQHNADDAKSPGWRLVALLPLSDEQIKEFALHHGVENPEDLLEDLQRRKAQSFARRPQDLIELCADWRQNRRIRIHRDQIKTNIHVKLEARVDRREACELSSNKAWEGASRLALAMQVMRLFTIRHSAASDITRGDAALNPLRILSDWQPNEVTTLLERPLFSFASYGRVRFHHRSVMEYLAAERLTYLREQRMPLKSLRRLIFAETKGKVIVRPSKRPVAAWLALNIPSIFELLRDHEPEVLLNEGDPEALSLAQRKEILRAFANIYYSSGWRGMDVPSIQVERFASSDLADEIRQLWQGGVENPEVRLLLIGLIGAGNITFCADIAYSLLENTNSPDTDDTEKIKALQSLVVLNDERLNALSACIAKGNISWSNRAVSRAAAILFPQFMSPEQLCQTIRWIKPKEDAVWDIRRHLPWILENTKFDYSLLEQLRDSIVKLLTEGLRWQQEWPNITSDWPQYCEALAATCSQGIKFEVNDKWLHACVLALCINRGEQSVDTSVRTLREHLLKFPAQKYRSLFWAGDIFFQSLHKEDNSDERLYRLSSDGPVPLIQDRDLPWLQIDLADKSRSIAERAMLCEAIVLLTPDHQLVGENLEPLTQLVADNPSLLEILSNRAIARVKSKERKLSFAIKQAKREEQARRVDAKNRAAWIEFWREVAKQPDDTFSSDKSFATAWNLWNFMRRLADMADGGSWSVWNRSAIEDYFDRATADRLKSVLTTIWRNDSPALTCERPDESRNSYLKRWELGLAAISAEAEDLEWAKKLTEEEAQRAVRYAPLELSGLPQWVGPLVEAHPSAAEVLWKEVAWELDQALVVGSYSWLLQQLKDASENMARVFLPRLLTWLESGVACNDGNNDIVMAERIRHATRPIINYGDDATKTKLAQIAQKYLAGSPSSELRNTWLSTLLQIDPERGVVAFEQFANTVEPSARSEVVSCFSTFFGNRDSAVNLRDKLLTPQLLLRLLRLAYQHVRVGDDTPREETRFTDLRDDAESARYNISNALFSIKGEEGFSAQLEMGADPLCEHFKDRLIAMAEENWAQEIDAHAYDEQQAIALDKRGEAPAASNESMFGILKDRLSDLDDLLLRDTSPREAWAGIDKESVLRREIARVLEYAANSLYTVDQEAVTADEKETDIRLRSVVGGYEAVIELKLGDGRTAKDLRDTIENQLVKKYLAAEKSRAGALLVAISIDRQWEHPDEGKKINVGELTELLRNEAERVQIALGSKVFIMIHLLDLRPRLSTEKKAKTKA